MAARPERHIFFIAAASAFIALATASFVVGRGSGARTVDARVQQDADFAALRDALAHDSLLLEQERGRADRMMQALTEQMIRMQTQLVYLDSLAVHLVKSTDIPPEDFDFRSEPPRGGPEELSTLQAADPDETLAGATDHMARQLDDRWRQLNVLADLLVWRKLSDEVRPEGLPVASAYISSLFGDRIDPLSGRPAAHKGVDFAGRPGTEIVAVAAVIVIWSGHREGYGEMVEIDHGNDRVTRYAHNAENLVAVGDVVTRGQPIARLGNTGRTTGPNLHFEVLSGGRAVDPMTYMK
jgi:murein DD-endopeptidase MepM/ murein hydrolase activator NlpD